MSLSAQLILTSLNRLKPASHLYVGYSGGVDSHVLLHLCASIKELKDKITAVYVHHGLQTQADTWARHCETISEALGVDFLMLRVNANASRGESPEDAARNARYNALKPLLGVDDVLMVGQHREDQLETVLMQLFRGGGLPGLSGMPENMPFGWGVLIRPLLNVAKAAVNDYAETHQLNWIEDPTNQQCDFDRNFIRNEILPRLRQRWPSIDKTVARSAQHCADAQQLLSEWTGDLFDLAYDSDDQTLNIARLTALTPNQRSWVLRQWFAVLCLKPPSQAVLQAIVEQVLHAGRDANPEIQNQGHFFKRYRQKLFCLNAASLQRESNEKVWPAQESSLLMANGYALGRVESASGISQRLWQASEVTVSCRQGGEKIKLPGRSGHYDLKKLYQQAGIPPWERETRPLVYLNGRLAAVAGLWIDEWAWAEDENGCYQLQWKLN